jgi:ArsR family transcriptional regulator, arsenate/arsenite/antimonite-responsive transcriptional repressor
MNAAYPENARIFKAFCDENRLRILELLQDGELCACVLVEKLNIKQPALSYHMKILVESGIVQSTPVGKWTHYRISETGCAYAEALLHDLTAPHAEAAEVCECVNV